ncbi:cell surface protein [Borreliella lusitaniae]|uniref:Cell surface protein n=1 Tax=Borreliella lusitaniae TaxID=100177 RepID=A0ACD5GP48_9SPIR
MLKLREYILLIISLFFIVSCSMVNRDQNDLNQKKGVQNQTENSENGKKNINKDISSVDQDSNVNQAQPNKIIDESTQRNIEEFKNFAEKTKGYSLKLRQLYNATTGKYNDILNFSHCDSKYCTDILTRAISVFKKDEILNEFKDFEKIIEEYKPGALKELIDDFVAELNKLSLDKISDARPAAAVYKKLMNRIVLAYIEMFDIVSSKFVDNKFVEASKEFIDEAQKFVARNQLIALHSIVGTISNIVNERDINNLPSVFKEYTQMEGLLRAAAKLDRAYKALIK